MLQGAGVFLDQRMSFVILSVQAQLHLRSFGVHPTVDCLYSLVLTRKTSTCAGEMFGSYGLMAGQWGPSSFKINDGIQGGPLALFDRVKTANTLIISPASRFMSSSIWRQNSSTGGDNVYWGTMGGVENVPVDVETSFILFCGNQGINKAFVSWGQILKQWHGRTDQYVKSDFTLNYLAYGTDNGAYYCYRSEDGKNYQDTVLDITSYMATLGVPIRYMQYDVTWYSDLHTGVVSWSSPPDVFPNGPQWLYNKTEIPVFGYNPFWASNTTYAKANGGEYDFLIDGPMSLPLEERFWTDLLAGGRTWGLIAYEQDYLDVEFEGIQKLLTDIDLGRQWLTQMGNGPAKNGLDHPMKQWISMFPCSRQSSQFEVELNRWSLRCRPGGVVTINVPMTSPSTKPHWDCPFECVSFFCQTWMK
ncbi:uncharacterized protein LOC124271947 [Haliotis rubra]|uniref:uncharacterized protein LOC124271947 n=1 Tax=Haliotis rubra TaxID=36100 RepID=UPI001EE5604B|nr:uncharacterized protein LOC124271947 [Haliotis rubra]